jgi:hypothetical protein
MGIKLKSEDEVWDRLSLPTGAAITLGDAIVCPISGSIKAIFAVVAQAGVTGTLTLNLLKNGSNLFTDATPITFASGATAATYSATDFAAGTVLSVKKTDVIGVSVTTVQTTAALGVQVYILFTRRPNVAVTSGTMNPEDTRP